MKKYLVQLSSSAMIGLLAITLAFGIGAAASPIPIQKRGVHPPASASQKVSQEAPDGAVHGADTSHLSGAHADPGTPLSGMDRPVDITFPEDASAATRPEADDPAQEAFAAPQPLLSDHDAGDEPMAPQPIPEPPSFLFVGVLLLLVGLYAGHRSRLSRQGSAPSAL